MYMEATNDFKRGYKSGFEDAQKVLKQNEMLRTFLLEAIGYDDEWITTVAGYKKYNKNDLINIILNSFGSLFFVDEILSKSILLSFFSITKKGRLAKQRKHQPQPQLLQLKNFSSVFNFLKSKTQN
jgi:hypothetical protein